jgi:hypothetical protein
LSIVLQDLEGLQPFTLVLDDTPQRWPSDGDNLMGIAKYRFWDYGEGMVPLFGTGQDEESDTDMLAAAFSLVTGTAARVLHACVDEPCLPTPLLTPATPWGPSDMRHGLQKERLQVSCWLSTLGKYITCFGRGV